MTTVPPPNVALPQLLAAATATTTIVIPAPPPALAAIPVGTTIEAIVLPPPPLPAAGLTPAKPPSAPQAAMPAPTPALPTTAMAASTPQVVVLHTAVGDLTVRLPTPLPARVPVELEVVRTTPQQVTVRLASIDGTPALQYLVQNRTPAASAVMPAPAVSVPRPQLLIGPQPLQPGAGWMPGGPAPFVQFGTISAIVTQAPALSEAPAPQAPPTPSPPSPAPAPVQVSPLPTLTSLPLGTGSEVALRIVSVQLPGAPAVFAPVANAPLATAPPMAASPPPLTPQLQAPLAAPTTLQAAAPTLAPPAPQPGLTLAGPQGLPPAPPQPPAFVQSTPPLTTTTGTVIANVDSIPVVEAEGRQVQLNVRANLPVGTKIVFEVTASTPPRTGALLPLPLPAAAVPLSGPVGAYTGWPTLVESASVLQRSDPIAAQQLAQAIPDGGPRTAAALISFVQAMRSGDARQWPGDTTLRALERTGPRGAHLAATLSGEVAELGSRARDGGAEWRALPIPWNAGGEIERVALITRREGEGESEESKAKKGGGTRFLIDLNLSRLGPMQLDGMFKTEARSFDMVLRTKGALPEDMRRDLLGLFTEANGAMGLKGGLTFQVTKKFADPLGAANSPDKSGLWA
jgi:hypothetical protein